MNRDGLSLDSLFETRRTKGPRSALTPLFAHHRKNTIHDYNPQATTLPHKPLVTEKPRTKNRRVLCRNERQGSARRVSFSHPLLVIDWTHGVSIKFNKYFFPSLSWIIDTV